MKIFVFNLFEFVFSVPNVKLEYLIYARDAYQ